MMPVVRVGLLQDGLRLRRRVGLLQISGKMHAQDPLRYKMICSNGHRVDQSQMEAQNPLRLGMPHPLARIHGGRSIQNIYAA